MPISARHYTEPGQLCGQLWYLLKDKVTFASVIMTIISGFSYIKSQGGLLLDKYNDSQKAATCAVYA